MIPTRPLFWNAYSGFVAPEWDWNDLGLISLMGCWQQQPFDFVREGITGTHGSLPSATRADSPVGGVLQFNTGGRDSESWAIPRSADNLLEGLNTFTFGQYLRTNYVSSSTDEDTLFGHWQRMASTIASARILLWRWDSNSQQFEFFIWNGAQVTVNGAISDTGFDDGNLHAVVVVAKAGSCTIYRDGVVIGTGSFTGVLTAENSTQFDWEMPGGTKVTEQTADSPRVDVATQFVSNKAWSDELVRAWSRDPFGLVRPDFRVIGKAPAVAVGNPWYYYAQAS